MAMVTAAGMPRKPNVVMAMKNTSWARESVPTNAGRTAATTMSTRRVTATKASHRICSRSSRSARRTRQASEAMDSTAAANPTAPALARTEPSRPLAPLSPNGLRTCTPRSPRAFVRPSTVLG